MTTAARPGFHEEMAHDVVTVTGTFRNHVEPAGSGGGAILVSLSSRPKDSWRRVFEEEAKRNSLTARIDDHGGEPVVWLHCERGRVQERYDESRSSSQASTLS